MFKNLWRKITWERLLISVICCQHSPVLGDFPVFVHSLCCWHITYQCKERTCPPGFKYIGSPFSLKWLPGKQIKREWLRKNCLYKSSERKAMEGCSLIDWVPLSWIFFQEFVCLRLYNMSGRSDVWRFHTPTPHCVAGMMCEEFIPPLPTVCQEWCVKISFFSS